MSKIKEHLATAFIIILLFGYITWPKTSSSEAFLREKDPNLPVIELNGIGDSMEPFIHSGDKVYYQPFGYHTIRAGQVVVFWKDAYRVAHKADYKLGESWVTKGINNKNQDIPISVDQYIGVLIKNDSVTILTEK